MYVRMLDACIFTIQILWERRIQWFIFHWFISGSALSCQVLHLKYVTGKLSFSEFSRCPRTRKAPLTSIAAAAAHSCTWPASLQLSEVYRAGSNFTLSHRSRLGNFCHHHLSSVWDVFLWGRLNKDFFIFSCRAIGTFCCTTNRLCSYWVSST